MCDVGGDKTESIRIYSAEYRKVLGGVGSEELEGREGVLVLMVMWCCWW